MRISINGNERHVEEGVTLANLLTEIGISVDSRGVATALNSTVIPRSRWGETSVTEGDSLEIVKAIQGG